MIDGNIAPVYRCILKMGMKVVGVSTTISPLSHHKIINVEFFPNKNGMIFTHYIHLPDYIPID